LAQLATAQQRVSRADASTTDLRAELAAALAAERVARQEAGTSLSAAETRAALLATANAALAQEEASF